LVANQGGYLHIDFFEASRKGHINLTQEHDFIEMDTIREEKISSSPHLASLFPRYSLLWDEFCFLLLLGSIAKQLCS